jgi:hypothetical protein
MKNESVNSSIIVHNFLKDGMGAALSSGKE